jgi:hypothetical protein
MKRKRKKENKKRKKNKKKRKKRKKKNTPPSRFLLALACYGVTFKVKVKVKVTLEQATKVQRGSTGVALLFP